MRAISGADPGRDQVQLPAVRCEPGQYRRDAAQTGRLLRGAAAAAAGVQGHHRPGIFVARHPVLAWQPRAGLGRGARACRALRCGLHAEHADTGVAGRTHGRLRTSRPRRRVALAGPPDAYDESSPLPPPWYPQPGPPPAPGAEVIPGPMPVVRLPRDRRAAGSRSPPRPPQRQDRANEAGRDRREGEVQANPAAPLAPDGQFGATDGLAGTGSDAAAVRVDVVRNWRGIANVPVTGRPGHGSGPMTIYVQMPDTLALNVNSRVRVADVFVGTVRAIELKNWVATLTLGIETAFRLPRNATARIGQTSLLGSQHVELAAPPDPSPEPLKNGDTIPLKNSSGHTPTPNDAGQHRHHAQWRRHPQPRSDTDGDLQHPERTRRPDSGVPRTGWPRSPTSSTSRRDDITRAIDSTNRLLAIVAKQRHPGPGAHRSPPLIKHFAESRDQFADAIEALGRISRPPTKRWPPSSDNIAHQPAAAAAAAEATGSRRHRSCIEALRLLLTAPFPIEHRRRKLIRGDYINVSLTVDLTLRPSTTSILTGTGFSGCVRALEQSWGRDPATMIPDVRFTPNPNNAPGGPLVERDE